MEINVVLIRHYAALGKLPVGAVHIGECSGTMLRDTHYADFVIPFTNRLAAALGRIRLHSCGNSDHRLETMKGIDRLCTLDSDSNWSLAMRWPTASSCTTNWQAGG